jgi:hypothetical protein
VAVTSIPFGATLVAETVPVQAGTAVINFDARTFKAGDVTTNRVLDQVAASLAGLGDVSAVQVLFSGLLQGKVLVPAAASLASGAGTDQALVQRESTLGFLTADRVAPLSTLSPLVTSLAPTKVALSRDRTLAALNTSAGVISVTADKRVAQVDGRDGLIPAAIDPNSFIWTVPEDSPRVMLVTGLAGTSRSVRVPWSDAKRISFISFSADGSRVLAGLVTPAGNKICVAGVRRGDDLWPQEIGSCLDEIAPSGTLISGAWIDGTRVAILSRTNVASLRISTVGGKYIDVTPPAGSVEVTGSGSLLSPRILTSEGGLYEQTATTRWTLIGSKVSLLGSSSQ